MSLQKISLLSIVNRSFTVFISIVLLSHSVVATASTSIEVAQQPQSNSQDANIAAANTAVNQATQLLKEGQALLSPGTAKSKEQALAKYDEALKILRKIDVNQLPIFIYPKFRNVEATVLQSIGSLYHAQTKPQEALKYLNEALSVRQELQQRLEKTIQDINSKSNLENKQQLLNFFQEALYYNNLGQGFVFDLLGSAYLQNSQSNDAIEYYEKALSLFNSTNQLNSEANTLTNIALLYQNKDDWKQAISYHKRALKIQRTLKDFRGQANTLKNLGVIYVVLGDAKQAVNALEESLKIFRQINDVDGQNEIRKFIESVKSPQKKRLKNY
jgi:tetratricopeptide (TPR) repeat protein